jgi:hypothetical protein
VVSKEPQEELGARDFPWMPLGRVLALHEVHDVKV